MILKNKNAIVTGASKGLGYAACRALAKEGANLLLVARNEAELKNNADELLEYGVNACYLAVDITAENSLQKIIAKAEDNFNQIDILVNNAGIIRRSPATDYQIQDWQAVINTNLNIPFLLAQSVGKSMIENKVKGKIINIASLLSYSGGLNVAAYTASKHAIAGITKSLANEWGRYGINVNAIAPGYFHTDATKELQANKERYDYLRSRIPMGRWGEPEDIEGAIVFLASGMSNYVSGHLLAVDGGWLAS